MGCQAAKPEMQMWSPKFHITDYKTQTLRSSAGEVVKASEPKFDKFICLTEEELYGLYAQCNK